MPKTPAADAFIALGLTDQTAWTPAMHLAVKQRWTDLPLDVKVGELRDRIANLTAPEVPDVGTVKANLILANRAEVSDADAKAEHARLKRNAGVNAWRQRGQLQAALDARDLKFKALRAKVGKTAAPRAGTATGDAAPALTGAVA